MTAAWGMTMRSIAWPEKPCLFSVLSWLGAVIYSTNPSSGKVSVSYQIEKEERKYSETRSVFMFLTPSFFLRLAWKAAV